MDVSLFFDAVDQSYSNLFEGFRDWEKTACAVLLSYENVCRLDPAPAHVDIRKYGVMHALRWGRNAPSKPLSLTDSNAELAVEILQAADTLRRRGSEYVGVFACRQLLKKEVLSVESITESSIATIGDLNWFAFEHLDDILDGEDADNAVMDAEWLVHLREELEVALTMTTCRTLEEFYLSQSQLFRSRMAQAGNLLSSSYRVPSNWECLGVSIESVRQVGVSIFLVATIHTCLTSKPGFDDWHTGRLLIWRKTDLVQCLANSSNLPTSTVRQIIDQLVYQREISPPDIALQPFLQANSDWLIASPWMLLSSNFERNWLSLLARINKKQFDDCSSEFATAMAQELASWLENIGYRAKTGLRLRDGSTDLDLVVWSPDEKFLLTAELKAMIQTADLMEVLNRGEQTARKSIENQLPKHNNALDQNSADVVERAFGIRTAVIAYDSLLVCCGFCGTSRLPRTFPCVDERLFKKAIVKCNSLSDAAKWLRSYLWLPAPGPDCSVDTITITAPNGFTITYPDTIVNKSLGR